MKHPISLFYVYAEQDEALRGALEKHLTLLQRQGVITKWRQSLAGALWKEEQTQALGEASLILSLVSADFVASDVCYEEQMQRALEWQRRGEVQVVPILLRPCDWKDTPFAALPMAPMNARPVTVWSDQDAAWTHVVACLRSIIEGMPLPSAEEAMSGRSTAPTPLASVWNIPYLRNPFFTGERSCLPNSRTCARSVWCVAVGCVVRRTVRR